MSVENMRQRAGSLVLIFLCLSSVVGYTVAGPVFGTSGQTAEWRSAVQSGARMEHSHQWLDAIEHYEKSLENWPENSQLQYGLRRAKIHFAIERRYADRSFKTSLLKKSRSEALSLFDDALYQIRRHYVKPVSSTSFVAHGTESLYLALANAKFIEENLAGVDANRIERMRTILKEKYWNKPLTHGTAARELVAQICDAAGSLLGMTDAAVVMEYIFGGCNVLDDYSSYLTPDRLDDLYGNIEGEFVGLGIEMKAEAGKGLLLVNVLPQSPASEGGLRRGDHILEINSVDCRDMKTDEAANLLRGRAGSRVRLTYQAPNSQRTQNSQFVRRAVQVKSIPVAKIIDPDNGVGYIKMVGFQKTSPRELDEALKKLNAEGMRSLVWDLRGNPGGLLSAAAEVLDRFIANGVLVSTRGRERDENSTYSAYRQGTWNLPLVLLLDGNSASASEIVAGAIRDHKRGTLIGRRTYGKWSVQGIFHVRDRTGLRLTVAKFYSPHGHNHSKEGVDPDIPVDYPQEHTTFYRGAPDGVDVAGDPDLQKGLGILRKQYTRR